MGSPSDIMRENVDALTCGKDGQFQTASLEPGTYTVAVEVYRPETPEESHRTGIRLPAYIGSANVIVTTNAAPPPVTIDLHARVAGKESGSANDSSQPQGVITGKVIDVESRQSLPASQSNEAQSAKRNPSASFISGLGQQSVSATTSSARTNSQSSESLVTSAATKASVENRLGRASGGGRKKLMICPRGKFTKTPGTGIS